jgi:hypothetical protein
MTSAFIDSALSYLPLVCFVLLVGRLVLAGLFRVYPVFFALVCVSALQQAAAVYFGNSSLLYFYSFVVLRPICILLSVLVVWELFNVIFRNYAGLRSLSQWVMGAAAAIALLGFVISITGNGSMFRSGYMRALIRLERGIALGLVIFIIAMLYFISRYPMKLPRNSVAHSILYSVWFLGDAAILLASSFLKSNHLQVLNNGSAAFESACYIGWTILLTKEGEYQETRMRRDIPPETEKSLIGELDAMNAMLLRAGRSMGRN